MWPITSSSFWLILQNTDGCNSDIFYIKPTGLHTKPERKSELSTLARRVGIHVLQKDTSTYLIIVLLKE